MKTCLCCGLLSLAEAVSCHRCGEGSWSAVSAQPAPEQTHDDAAPESDRKPVAKKPKPLRKGQP